jgi:aryl-alcohol dehydrogenase-like predicted oxidoreductase
MVPTFTETNFDKLEKMQQYAIDRGHTVEELSLAWLLARPFISSIIAGARTIEQVDAHVKAAAWKLTEDEITEIEKLISDTPAGDFPPPGPPHL